MRGRTISRFDAGVILWVRRAMRQPRVLLTSCRPAFVERTDCLKHRWTRVQPCRCAAGNITRC